VLSGGDDKTVRLWDIETGKCIRIFETDALLFSLCFSPDERMMLSGGYDETVKTWDIATGECICALKGHTGSINYVCFSPDNKKILSGSRDKTAKLWDLTMKECILTFDGFTSEVQKVCFSPDGQQIALSSSVETHIYTICYDLHFPGWHNWDEGARPYLDIFLTVYPDWTDDDFNNILIPDLQNRGYGWLRPEGVKIELLKMSKHVKTNENINPVEEKPELEKMSNSAQTTEYINPVEAKTELSTISNKKQDFSVGLKIKNNQSGGVDSHH